DLPEAGDAGPHAQPRLAPRGAELVLAAWAGPGADDGHVADQHVPELGEFVDVQVADEPADAGKPGVVVDEELWAVGTVLRGELGLDLLGVLPHGAELEATELAAAQALALVGEEERPAVLKPD